MNYYNPYFYTLPNAISTPKVGLFSRLLGRSGITLSGIFNGTQKVLNFANQAIPLVKQIRPMVGNAKTMFKVMNEFKKVDLKINNKKSNISKENTTIIKDEQFENTIKETQNNNGPIFFM